MNQLLRLLRVANTEQLIKLITEANTVLKKVIHDTKNIIRDYQNN